MKSPPKKPSSIRTIDDLEREVETYLEHHDPFQATMSEWPGTDVQLWAELTKRAKKAGWNARMELADNKNDAIITIKKP